ncbi:MAG: circularly permuted type 2 ATP-grasp protein [Sphingomonadales bacterium]|nr:circularly permuted type 2 ATP-grasp protein [Sphingomonadales bacterium]MDE2170077.1 circularly permuted type 2 ATP-grasp protein [Sphingomonadales bacterium]
MHWRAMARGLAELSDEDGPGRVEEQIAHQIRDMGLTFRMAGDESEREWPLTPMPLLIGGEEWATIEAGVIQRAHLLEAIIADVYGPGHLVASGQLPSAVLAGSPYFARKMLGMAPPSGHWLHVCAMDLTRGPDGQWCVLADRVRLASGIGYALENRLAMSRATGTLLGEIHARRLAGFFADLREGLAADCARDRPRIALLTPGRLNQSYSEQAHLARYLGLPLVEGRDMVVNGDRLYVRTIAGPKRVDALWRWIDTNALDPLSFDVRSTLGVPDLLSTLPGGALVANWPGAEVVESRAMAAQIDRLCVWLRGERTLLCAPRNWWCGDDDSAAHVAVHLDELLIAPAFHTAEGLGPNEAVPGASLSSERRASLLEAMARRPMDYCGQSLLPLGQTPALVDGALVPRPFSLRVFAARDGRGNWTVMPGGFARILPRGDEANALIGMGDLSADVCVVDRQAQPSHGTVTLSEAPIVYRGGAILASQSADNLFWFARYAERTEFTLRILRAILGSSIDADAAPSHQEGVTRALINLLQVGGALPMAGPQQSVIDLCASALAEARLPGGVTTLIQRLQDTGRTLRQRFARDFWLIASRPMPHIDDTHPQSMLEVIKQLLERLSALSGMIAENMMRGAAHAFIDMGRRIERALAICRVARCLSDTGEAGLNGLLDLCDSQITYRSRYLTGAARLPVLDLVLLDPDNPRSLAFQVQLLVDRIAALPTLDDNHLPEQSLLDARAILAPLQTRGIAELDGAMLHEIEMKLLALSDRLSDRYFLPGEKVEARAQGPMLS